MSDYQTFLANKRVTVAPSGFDVSPDAINPQLFLFQRDIALWMVRLGRAACFANVGLGKTLIQLEVARLVAERTSGRVMIVAPLAVPPQTIQQAKDKLGITVNPVTDNLKVSVLGDGGEFAFITNFDSLSKFDLSQFTCVIVDESSILKHYSKTFFWFCEACQNIPYRFCFTATPSPNDIVEIGNHAMFLGIMHFKDMLARWFVGEGDLARHARLKRHAEKDFWRWLTSWAVCISKPVDLGEAYDMPGYDLPPMFVHEYRLAAPQGSIERAWANGKLLPDDSANATQFHKVKRESLKDRVEQARLIVADIPENDPVILWCHTDYEADALKKAFPGAIEVHGSQTPTRKEHLLKAFSSGQERLIITKPSIAGMGLNWQHCNQAIYVGVDFSFETTFQSMGRIHRYGQKRDVHFHMIYSETEGSVAQILKSKQAAFEVMQAEMSAAIREYGLFREESNVTVFTDAGFTQAEGKGWAFIEGDCVAVMDKMEPESVDLTVTSIPFGHSLYTYSDKQADVGNAETPEEFWEHMKFVIRGLWRITRPGRCVALHVKDLPLFENRDGLQGIMPFSDDTVTAFRDLRVCEACGWTGFASEGHRAICPQCTGVLKVGWAMQSQITIEKDPVVEMEKTNSHGLLYKNWRERSELLRVGLPDYMLIFQKPGDDKSRRVIHDPNDETYFGDNPPQPHEWLKLPTRKGQNNYNLPVWQRVANPNWSDVVVPLVWADIDQTDVLNYLIAKSDKDSRHICPLQLDVIARCIHWKSNEGEVIFDPFGGIGSTGYKALEMKRQFIGVELKPEYHALGTKYLKAMEIEAGQPTIWDFLPAEASAE